MVHHWLVVALVAIASAALVVHAAGSGAFQAQVWLTNSMDARYRMFHSSDITFDNRERAHDMELWVDDQKLFQPIVGYGAALSDSSAFLLNTLKTRDQGHYMNIIKSLFTTSGAGFSMLRVPASSSDFSVNAWWTYDDVAGDTSLSHFNLDRVWQYTIPIIKDVLAVNPRCKIMLSPWSAPAWMKEPKELSHGYLRPDMYEVYARFLAKMIDQYQQAGVPVNYLTLQNEPHNEPNTYPGMYMSGTDAAGLIKALGRAIVDHNNANLRDHAMYPLNTTTTAISPKILAWDHNWNEGVDFVNTVYGDAEAKRLTAGSAWHCYAGEVQQQNEIYTRYPDKEMHFTECSGGEWSPDFKGNLNWQTEKLCMGSVEYGAQSVQTWNIALDTRHGPQSGGCKDCRGVLTIHDDAWTVDYNVEWFSLGMFGKFLSSSASGVAHRLHTSANSGAVAAIGFRVEQSSFVGGRAGVQLNLLNQGNNNQTVKVNYRGQFVNLAVAPGSTALFWAAQ